MILEKWSEQGTEVRVLPSVQEAFTDLGKSFTLPIPTFQKDYQILGQKGPKQG